VPTLSVLRRTVPAVALAATAALTVGAAGSSAVAATPTVGSARVAAANTCPTWTVMKNAVNFRTGPATSYRSIGYLYKWDYGTKVAGKGSWVKLRLSERSKSGLKKGTTAWVHKNYVDQCVYMQY
jgi:hypothetical protein